ncbi:hypothetical protein [Ruminococcus sp.]|uniref:hypothetical protein n=1 Tax=Ruminococcus sp. TaxID=41978 RepID=UPI0025D34BF3|nr:hypothetical protein [Ruminococcus sp.]MBQ8966479.1 hypothetical protein [Ruminococcus sp.]
MKNNEIKKIMNDNRNDIAKASRLGVGIVLGAVILIGIIFYGIAPKTHKKDKTESLNDIKPQAVQKTAEGPEKEEVVVAEEEVVEMPVGHLYRVAADTSVTDKNGGFIGAATEGDIYTSYDELDIAEFGTGKQIEIDYLSQKGFLPADDLNEVMSAVVLPTSGNSIMKDEYSGSYPCDPENSDVIAAAALVNSQKLRSWDKADLISAESILEAEGDLVKLIDDYSGGDLIAQKLTDVSESAIRSQIDSGKRVLLAVRYYNGVTDFDYSDYYGVTSETRYVIVCGYDEDEEYGNIFYCCDPFYGQGGRSLATVSAETLCTSAGLVDDARKGMIILK